MEKLKDSQIWESDKCIIQIQERGKAAFDFMAVIFEKKSDGSLKFNNILFNEKNRILNFIEHLNMQEVGKKIITRKRR